jgi:hypothetical protein
MSELLIEKTEYLTPRARGELSILNGKGDTTLGWNPENEDEVEAAEAMFEELTAKGFQAFEVSEEKGKEGGRGKVIRKFDPKARRIIMSPRIGGG